MKHRIIPSFGIVIITSSIVSIIVVSIAIIINNNIIDKHSVASLDVAQPAAVHVASHGASFNAQHVACHVGEQVPVHFDHVATVAPFVNNNVVDVSAHDHVVKHADVAVVHSVVHFADSVVAVKGCRVPSVVAA